MGIRDRLYAVERRLNKQMPAGDWPPFTTTEIGCCYCDGIYETREFGAVESAPGDHDERTCPAYQAKRGEITLTEARNIARVRMGLEPEEFVAEIEEFLQTGLTDLT